MLTAAEKRNHRKALKSFLNQADKDGTRDQLMEAMEEAIVSEGSVYDPLSGEMLDADTLVAQFLIDELRKLDVKKEEKDVLRKVVREEVISYAHLCDAMLRVQGPERATDILLQHLVIPSHPSRIDGLYAGPSQIIQGGELGLFTSVPIASGTIIGMYTGDLIQTRPRDTGSYDMEMPSRGDDDGTILVIRPPEHDNRASPSYTREYALSLTNEPAVGTKANCLLTDYEDNRIMSTWEKQVSPKVLSNPEKILTARMAHRDPKRTKSRGKPDGTISLEELAGADPSRTDLLDDDFGRRDKTDSEEPGTVLARSDVRLSKKGVSSLLRLSDFEKVLKVVDDFRANHAQCSGDIMHWYLMTILPGAKAQVSHADNPVQKCYATIIVPLTRDPQGSGTFFVDDDKVVNPYGGVLIFSGKEKHYGSAHHGEDRRIFLYATISSGGIDANDDDDNSRTRTQKEPQHISTLSAKLICACRDIERGEELCFHYGDSYGRGYEVGSYCVGPPSQKKIREWLAQKDGRRDFLV